MALCHQSMIGLIIGLESLQLPCFLVLGTFTPLHLPLYSQQFTLTFTLRCGCGLELPLLLSH